MASPLALLPGELQTQARMDIPPLNISPSGWLSPRDLVYIESHSIEVGDKERTQEENGKGIPLVFLC